MVAQTALPDLYYFPAVIDELPACTPVAKHVPAKFLEPEFSPRGRRRSELAAAVSMPETAVHEHASSKSRQHYVRTARESFRVESVTEAARMEEPAHKHLGPGILAANTRHHAGASECVNDVRQVRAPQRIVSRRISAGDPIPVVDLFAGPGGLGEGFASLGEPTAPTFRIQVSVEMDPAAHKTLRLRAYYRALLRTGDTNLQQVYYDYCHGLRDSPYDQTTIEQWNEAEREAQLLTLGDAESDRKLYEILDGLKLSNRPWVLIGGPPCQAYSLVGRSRNRGKKAYRAEDDHRHFLYREYLKIIQRYRPTVFVMENVKGLLSATVGEQRVFHQMLVDLADPDTALHATKERQSTTKYRIHSLVSQAHFDARTPPDQMNVSAFIVRAEEFGIPQARHRVILLGVRDESDSRAAASGALRTLKRVKAKTVSGAIRQLPRLRSTLTRQRDTLDSWRDVVRQHAQDLASAEADLARRTRDARRHQLAEVLRKIARSPLPQRVGASRAKQMNIKKAALGRQLAAFLQDPRLQLWLNHEARGHMSSDLRRYLYAAAYARTFKTSPKGHKQFGLPGLEPDHKNWKSGKFADRFRVQLWHLPATTVTSHISKDGHYYIHPDPEQCRSLTVREAARLQTFPDNYLFCGNRTQQYVQVGNAVPPFLARQIAAIVKRVLE